MQPAAASGMLGPMMKSVPAMQPRHDERRYADLVDDGFWPKIRRLAARLPFAEDLLAAYYAATDPQTPTRVRAVLLAALAYFVTPADLIPDVLSRTHDVADQRFRRSRMNRLITLLLATLLLPAGFASAATAADDPYRGKVAVITGSSSGLGRELAEIGAAKGMKLVLADINLAPSQQFAAEVTEAGGEAIAVEVDLAKPEQRARVVEAAMDRFGRVDYLFNNAGYSYLATLEQMDLADAHHLFEVNYWAYVDLANRVIPIMKAQGSGHILNVASILGHRPGSPGLGHYAATKHALVGMFQVAARELEPHNIRVHVASPGGMRTNISKSSTGPLADASRDRAADWEDPAVAANDIFAKMQEDEVVFFPGYVGRQRQP
jgi:NAD(P)-dependent dehydrogenase (short-subunit alcohol dehydrogenase family)